MKEKKLKPLSDKIMQFIPQRKIIRTQNFANVSNLKDLMLFESSQYNDITETVATEIGYFEKNQNEASKFFYISHQKKDGIVSADLLFKKLSEKRKNPPVYNPRVDEKSLTSYIKYSKLEHKAIERGYVEKSKVPLLGTIVSAVPGALLALNVLKEIIELTNFTGDSLMLNLIRGLNFNFFFTLFLIVFFLVCVGSAIIQSRKIKMNIKEQINKKLAELEDEEFLDFIDDFSGNDFRISDCNSDNSVYICVLQNYTFKEKHILKSFWSNASVDQMWLIFAEGTKDNNDFVVPASSAYRRAFYYQKPLSKSEKKKIATVAYSEKTNILPADDAGINNFGTDYLCRFYLNERISSADAKPLNEKIDKFCNEYTGLNRADVKLLIRAVADLSCTYGLDFSNARAWQHIFNFNQGDAKLNALDQKVTDALVLNNKVINRLIPEIMESFSADLEEIVANSPNNLQTKEYKQWCVIKALKSNTGNKERSFFAICDALMTEFAVNESGFDDMSLSETWKELLVKTAEVFYVNNFFWFLPTLINKLIVFFGDQNQVKGKLFSESIVLEIARANLLLSINSESENYSYARIDLIRDHYKIACLAAKEQNNSINLDANTSTPVSFELLQFTNKERRKYYNALHFLKEQAILDFFNYLFDMLCAIVSTRTSYTKFCYSALYENSLYDKYLKNKRISKATDKDYLRTISLKLLELFNVTFKGSPNLICNSINELRSCFCDEENDEPIDDSMFLLLVKFDMLGFNTLNFISCIIASSNNSDELTEDIYLNLGNYILGIVFLTYHEVSKATFYNEDFKYLVDIYVNYEEPGGTVLGFMYYCAGIAKPRVSGERIANFVAPRKAIFINNLKSVAQRIKNEDIEEFFSFLTSRLEDKNERNEIYKELKNRIELQYASLPLSGIYLEYISLCVTGESTKEFKDNDPKENIQKLLETSPNMVYLLYTEYYLTYKEEYSQLYYLVAAECLSASFEAAISTFIKITFRNEKAVQEQPQEFVRTIQLIVTALKLVLTENARSYEVLSSYNDFVFRLFSFLENYPELYSWLKREEVNGFAKNCDISMKKLAELQSQEFIALRKWSNYGIAIYMRVLLRTSLKLYYPEDYRALNASERISYIVEHFEELQHTLTIDEEPRFFGPYLDMVISFIHNYCDIQHRLDEKECTRKLTRDLMEIVKNHSVLRDTTKFQVCQLLAAYQKQID